MIAAPAVDLMGGRCVQLRGGVPEDEQVSLPDPVDVALRWAEAGFRTLHVVDLDAALGRGDNRALIKDILAASPATTQVGGGVRTTDAVRRLVEDGADRIIVGTRAIEDPEWLTLVARGFAGRVMLAADVRDGRVVRRGWTEAADTTAVDLVRTTADLPLAGILCTDVDREGRLEGVADGMAAEVVAASAHPVWMSGGITTLDDLRALAGAGASGAVLGMSLYKGTVDPDAVAREFGE